MAAGEGDPDDGADEATDIVLVERRADLGRQHVRGDHDGRQPLVGDDDEPLDHRVGKQGVGDHPAMRDAAGHAVDAASVFHGAPPSAIWCHMARYGAMCNSPWQRLKGPPLTHDNSFIMRNSLPPRGARP